MTEKSNLRPRAGHGGASEARSSGRDELGPNSEIGSKLRALYTSIQEETIPDRFLDLLEKLDQAERHRSGADDQ
ncbi:RNA polymerase [Paramesorhizobium deserti]|uniref:RNA polymerase n=1 Tax=Paramesorhizobium deserti TaxID=1494590 RepID=A0A135HSR5_9HYPH|nr:NepR family anti-sigma factor [Paramesorhizobium deserti]KXF76203.1 RNA polymerase [Paramesorhizobium deserti]